MRKIGELSSEHAARKFGDALFVRGLENDVEEEEDGTYSIWVHDHDQVEKGRALLEEFRTRPDDPEWQEAERKAQRRRKEEERKDEKRASQVITRERMEYERNAITLGWGPVLLAILSIAATVFAGEFGLLPRAMTPPIFENSPGVSDTAAQDTDRQEHFNMLAITRWKPPTSQRQFEKIIREAKGDASFSAASIQRLFFDRSLPEIRKGEVWRLFSPMLIHMGLLHLVFNLLWLRDLGSFLQLRFGSFYFWVFVLASSAVCNLVQLAWSGPMFGGLSGVNYALVGFLWMRGKFDRLMTWQLNPQTVNFMILWYFMCLTGMLGNVANAAHTAGLLFGMLAGFATAKVANWKLLKL